MIDLDELKEKWAEHDRKLETVIRLDRRILSTRNLDRAQSALGRATWFIGLDAIIQLIAVVALGSFVHDNLAVPRFAVPGAILDVLAIAILAAYVRQITITLSIDHDGPISTIQKRIESVRIERIRLTRWILLLSALAWPLLLIVGLKGFFGVDAYAVFGTAYLLVNLVFGLIVLLVGLWISKTFGRRLQGSRTFQTLIDDIAGSNLKAAAAFLAEIDRFADETGEG